MKRVKKRDDNADRNFSCGVVAVLCIVLLMLLGALVLVELAAFTH